MKPLLENCVELVPENVCEEAMFVKNVSEMNVLGLEEDVSDEFLETKISSISSQSGQSSVTYIPPTR